jgi:hypothetical protein
LVTRYEDVARVLKDGTVAKDRPECYGLRAPDEDAVVAGMGPYGYEAAVGYILK